MTRDVIMPAMELAQDTGTLLRWLKAEGEAVVKGEPLMEIETDKVTVEIEAPASGVLANVTAQPGDVIPVGQVVAVLLAEGEVSPEPGPAARRPTARPNDPHRSVAASPVARRLANEHGIDLAQIPLKVGQTRVGKQDVQAYIDSLGEPASLSPPQPRPAASPKARRLAAESGLDLAELKGSGPNDAVLAADIETDARRREPDPTPEVKAIHSAEYQVVPIQGVRKVIADRLQGSYQTAPHIALTLSVDMSETLRLSERLAPSIEAETGYVLTLTAVLSRVLGAILRKHPRLNAHLVDEEIREHESIHLGIAVALDDGLIVPVIRSVDQKGLAQIQTELADLTDRARAGKLGLDDIRGGTFTLSNLGMYEIEAFTAILNSPEVAILSVGVIKEIPVGEEGEVVLKPTLKLTVNTDHRAVDGAVAAVFLRDLKTALENPYLLLS